MLICKMNKQRCPSNGMPASLWLGFLCSNMPFGLGSSPPISLLKHPLVSRTWGLEIFDKCIRCGSSLTLKSCYVAQVFHQFRILLPQPSECWDYSYVAMMPASIVILNSIFCSPKTLEEREPNILEIFYTLLLEVYVAKRTVPSNLPSTHQRASLELKPRGTSPGSYEFRRKS